MTGPNVACEHRRTVHEHGSYVCYVLDRCRCDGCKAAHRAYERQRRQWCGAFPREAAPLVDAARARQHILELMDAGMGIVQVAHVAGLAPSVVSAIVWGRRDRTAVRIRRETESKLLACRLELADGAKVPVGEALLIVDELLAAGWTRVAVGRRVHGPESKSLQLGDHEVFAGTMATLRGMLFEQPPPRLWRDGRTRTAVRSRPPQVVVFATPGVRMPVVDGMMRDRFDPQTVAPKRALMCRFCGRALADHAIMDRCTVREPIGATAGPADATVRR